MSLPRLGRVVKLNRSSGLIEVRPLMIIRKSIGISDDELRDSLSQGDSGDFGKAGEVIPGTDE